jgi:hypothetical protein
MLPAGAPPAGASRGARPLPTDLGPSSQYVVDDVTEPVGIDPAGRLVVPGGAGIGVDVRPDRVAALAVAPGPVELRP